MSASRRSTGSRTGTTAAVAPAATASGAVAGSASREPGRRRAGWPDGPAGRRTGVPRRRRTATRRSAAAAARPIAGLAARGRRTRVGRRFRGVVRDRVAGQASELAGAIHADEDLAEEPLPASRLAAGAERLDGDLGDGAGGLGRGERPALEPFRGREQPPTVDEVRRRRPRPGADRAATLPRVRAPGGIRAPGGSSSTIPSPSPFGSATSAEMSR